MDKIGVLNMNIMITILSMWTVPSALSYSLHPAITNIFTSGWLGLISKYFYYTLINISPLEKPRSIVVMLSLCKSEFYVLI